MREFLLEPGEQIIQEARKHWLLFAAELLPYAILAIIPFAIPNALTLVPGLTPYAVLLSGKVGHVFIGVWLLLVWTSAWGVFTRYFLNVWILTNARIVEVKQRHFFARQVSSLLLSRVQDVTIDVEGVLPSLLQIGEIQVQSAGTNVEFVMHGIPRPELMRDLILKYVPEGDGKQAGV